MIPKKAKLPGAGGGEGVIKERTRELLEVIVLVLIQGRQRSRGCIPDASWESELDSRGSKGPRSPLESPQVSLGAH